MNGLIFWLADGQESSEAKQDICNEREFHVLGGTFKF